MRIHVALQCIAVISIFTGCSGGKEASSQSNGQDTAQTTVRKDSSTQKTFETKQSGPSDKNVLNRTPDFILTADELGKEYLSDKDVTRKKYANKVIELTGWVHSSLRNIDGDPLIWLKVKDGIGLICNLDEKEPWQKVTPGQTVKLKVAITPSDTRGADLIGGPILHGCIL
jgi:hypothetical protein